MKKNLPLSVRSVKFSDLPPAAAEEIRYVFGFKLTNGDWTPTPALRQCLELLFELVLTKGAWSFTDRRFEDWILFARQLYRGADVTFERSIAPYLRTFFSTLNRGLISDPWAENVWLWKGMFDRVMGAGAYASQPNINWSRIEQDWLREPLKAYARQCLQGSTRTWATIHTWSDSFFRLSGHLSLIRLTEPEQLTRKVFLGFLEEQRARYGDTGNMRQRINTTAHVLMNLKLEEFQPRLASEIYLRSGENPAIRIRNPRPWPKDTITQIESRILDSDRVDPQIRLMLRFCRWAGPRVSELVSLPIDSLVENGKGGYWVEYWMPKVSRFRRFPIVPELGRDLAAEALAVRAQFGSATTLLFPSLGRSNLSAGIARPWSAAGFRTRVQSLFTENGILSSAITGELISGADIHRFRHNIGTELLNAGWTQQQVMEFLGHVSPTMTAAYAKILDETLNRKADEFHRMVQADRAAAGISHTDPRVERLREMLTAVLPAGYCALPASKTCVVRENPCLTCSFHVPGDGEFDASRSTYRAQLERRIAEAAASGHHAIEEINTRILSALDGSGTQSTGAVHE
ncbi:tyrosine-type recombinase/integrase [Cryobacterium lactosi]|nr:tyrosine-type recombinase/integrase [Cryobacterium lactosi]